MRLAVVAFIALLPTSCSDLLYGWGYDHTDTGELKGRLVVEWVDQDKFLFIPDAEHPLVFTRKGGTEVIQPQRMFTDGGSDPAGAARHTKLFAVGLCAGVHHARLAVRDEAVQDCRL